MKVAITAQAPELSSSVDPRFGRAKYFVVVDTESGVWSAHDNAQNLNALQGAGIQAAQNVAELGVEAAVTGNVGPKAFAVLEAANVAIYTGAAGTVQEALDQLRGGGLRKVDQANVEGHWV